MFFCYREIPGAGLSSPTSAPSSRRVRAAAWAQWQAAWWAGRWGTKSAGAPGKDLATIAGAIGGGYAGHQIEKKIKTTKRHEISVRMDDGSHRTMVQETEPAFAIGEKVKIIDGALVRN